MPIPTELFTTIMAHMTPASTTDTAAATVRVWHVLFHKFSPLLGPLSADLLFVRSLVAHETAFPWLPRIAACEAKTAFREFERSLEHRAPEEIAAANHALLSTYTAVLSDLIGDGLATRFLGATFQDVDPNKETEE